MSNSEAYQPSLIRISKYWKYIQYFLNYLVWGDFKSILNSFRYTFIHKLQKSGYKAKSAMGTFWIRPESTDFQFINNTYELEVKRYIWAHKDNITHFIDVGAC